MRVQLAPGLTLYRAPEGKGDLRLVDGRGQLVLDIHRAATAPKSAMPAPVVGQLEVVSNRSRRWSQSKATASLKAAPPADARAVIMYAVDHGKRTPIAFALLPDTHDKLDSIDVFRDAGHCDSLPPGTRAPTKGEQIALAWVDAYGRLSPTSAPIATKAPANE